MQKEENLKKLKMEKRGDKMKTNKGITLIALVITIIVMLILVVVKIRISTNGGLFDYAGKAARETKDAIADEKDIADGKITIGGVTYNSIEDYINRDKISSVKLKYKVEGSNIMVYLEDSYIDYLETNELEASAGSDSAYTSYITNKIAEKPLEEKENYIVKVWNKQKGTSYKNIGELIATEYGSQEAFIEVLFPAPPTVERTAYLTIARKAIVVDDSNNSDGKTYEDAINEKYSILYWSKLSLELPNKKTIIMEAQGILIYGVTESGTYTFTATDVEGKTAKVDVPVEIPANTKFAIIKQKTNNGNAETGNRITIPITVGTTTWGDFVGQSIFGVVFFEEEIDNKITTIWGNTLRGGNTYPIISTTLIEETEYESYQQQKEVRGSLKKVNST